MTASRSLDESRANQRVLKPSGRIVPDQCDATLDSATTTTGSTNSQKHKSATKPVNAMRRNAPGANRERNR